LLRKSPHGNLCWSAAVPGTSGFLLIPDPGIPDVHPLLPLIPERLV
jgi:hypothetical protein